MLNDGRGCLCGHPDTGALLRIARTARCSGLPWCDRPVTRYFIHLSSPGQGYHAVSSLAIRGSCRRHASAVRGRLSDVGWLGVGEANADQLEEVIEWFHGESGLCLGRALAVVTPEPMSRPPWIRRVGRRRANTASPDANIAT